MGETMRQTYASAVRTIADALPEYRLGGDGSDGTCDCVGLGIGALRRMGIGYNGLHGSNWAARYEAVELWEIHDVRQLRIGDNVLKSREPGDAKWDLPDRYGDDPDQRDYYHMGVVVSVDPLRIVHMTSPTAKTDTVLGAWRHAFLWKQLAGGEAEEGTQMSAIYDARVVLSSGWLNLRAAPDAKSRDIGDVPNGAIVEVLTGGEWPFIRYAGKSGYVKGCYLERIEEAEEMPEEPEDAAQEAVTRLICEDGRTVELVGRWRLAGD